MNRTKNRDGKSHISAIAIASLGVLLLLALVVFLFGSVRGEEFSPQGFATRSFSYHQIPFLRFQVWPVRIYKMPNDLAKYLRTQKLLGEVSSQPARWDIVTMSEGGRQTYRGDASILTSYLRQPGAVGTESWLSWSKNHPGLARELWPVVAQLAQKNLYVIIPDVLEAARDTNSSDELAKRLRRLVVSELLQFAEAARDNGESPRADQLLDLALEYDPTNSAIPNAKSESP